MNTEVAGLGITQLVEKIELPRETQANMNAIYSDFCEIILVEMSNHLEEIRPSTVLKKRFKPRKPYWKEELDDK